MQRPRGDSPLLRVETALAWELNDAELEIDQCLRCRARGDWQAFVHASAAVRHAVRALYFATGRLL